MEITTKFLLDSGDPDEYKDLVTFAKQKGGEIWGSTTNPSLIAKKLAGQKITQQEAFQLQKDIAMEIISIVPGAVSVEVYADESTTAAQMIEQGKDIATWSKHIVVKLPTTLAGMMARTELRKAKISTNNTLVFSQQQIFAICLHEHLIQKLFGPTDDLYPPFISPFVGRLDDRGENGIDLVENGMKIKRLFDSALPKTSLAIWMLAASIRSIDHLKQTFATKSELVTAPGKLYKEWLALSVEKREKPAVDANLKPIAYWTPPQELLKVETIEEFFQAIEQGKLDITHPLTDTGLTKFSADWKTIISS